VVNQLSERSMFALTALQHFPPSIVEALLSDVNFQKAYELTTMSTISFHEIELSVGRNELFNAVREVLADGSAQPTLNDKTGRNWKLQLSASNNECRVELVSDDKRFVLPDFSLLSPRGADRLNGFDRAVRNVHLAESIRNSWRKLVTARALTDDEIVAFHTEIEATPMAVQAKIASEIRRGTSSPSTLVPRTESYFDCLVGVYNQDQDITQYARAGAREHICQLTSWRAYEGLLFSLLLSSHSSISSEIEAHQLSEGDLIRAYDWVLEVGDLISQIGAVEIGLSILDICPKIEPHLRSLIEKIRDDDADENHSEGRFHLLSALIVLVEGELSRTKILKDKPPFWRRLASIAQASLIERCITNSQVDISAFTKWALQARGQFFYLQIMADLRQEPRWYPDYVSASHLKAEFMGRIVGAAQRNDSKIHSQALRELLFSGDPGSIHSQMTFPLAFLPGPLEGSLKAQLATPAWVVSEIEKQLNEDILRPHSFTALLNSALIFHVDAQHAGLAAKALRTAKYQLRHTENKEILVSLLRGLATVAAVTRSGELAQEVKILTRRYRLQEAYKLSAEDVLWIGLIAAANSAEIAVWCEFVGDWITELAFQPLQPDEMGRLHSHLETLCQIVPELWRTCGRAEAALKP
jgi:hypothetical protein